MANAWSESAPSTPSRVRVPLIRGSVAVRVLEPVVFVTMSLTVMRVVLVIVIVIVMPVLVSVLNAIEVLVHVQVGQILIVIVLGAHGASFSDIAPAVLPRP